MKSNQSAAFAAVGNLAATLWSEVLWRLRHWFDQKLPIHPYELGATGCGDEGPWNYLCTRVAGHPGSHMAAANNGTAALWDDELEWDCHHGWGRA